MSIRTLVQQAACMISTSAVQQLAEPDSPTNQWLWYTVAVASSDTYGANASARRLAQKGWAA